VAAYVEPPGIKPPGEADSKRLDQYVRLAESLGASVVRLTGATVSGAILDYARKHNITRLIVGKPRRSRFRTGLRRSLLDQIVSGSGDIDVHVISGDPGADEARSEAPRRIERTPWSAYAWAALFVLVTTGLAVVVRALYSVPDLEILYVVTIMLAALRLGRAPSLVAAALSVAAYDFWFVPPENTFAVSDWHYLLSFLMMFGVGWLVSTLTTRIRRQEEDAAAREERTRTLFELGRDLAYARTVNATAAIAAKHAARAFESAVLVMLPDVAHNLERRATEPAEMTIDAQDMGVAKWVFEHGRAAGLGTDTLPGARVVCVPLRSTGDPVGVLVLQPWRSVSFDADQREKLDAFARQAAFALERAQLAREAEASAVRVKTEEMRSSLLSAVSHDLRTPLATITGAVTTLRDSAAHFSPAQEDELLSDIQSEAARLERLVSNLLDMTRVESGGLRIQREWVPLEELVGSALTRLDRVLKGRAVEVSIAPRLPLLSVDPILIEQVLVNLVENATKYTPTDARIDIDGRVDGDQIVVEVRDRGPGIRPGDEHRVFEKFYRGTEQGVSGAGLGLAICKGIVDAHGGSINVENRTGGGATFRVTLPVPAEAPPIEPAAEEGRAEA
jgi:two-component system sensor histidine kinase KdpD